MENGNSHSICRTDLFRHFIWQHAIISASDYRHSSVLNARPDISIRHWHLGYGSTISYYCWICATFVAFSNFFFLLLPRFGFSSRVWVVNNGSMSVRHTSRRPLWLWIVFSHNNVIYGFEGREWFSSYFQVILYRKGEPGKLPLDKFMLTFGKIQGRRRQARDNALLVMKQHLRSVCLLCLCVQFFRWSLSFCPARGRFI